MDSNKAGRGRLVGSLLILFLLNILLIVMVQQNVAAGGGVFRQGSSGEEVRTIQTKLKNWGYYNGAVDGIFGPKTKAAVTFFQKKNGLYQDGIVGRETLRALRVSVGGGSNAEGNTESNAGSAQKNNLALLARIISAEARGEPFNGQVAIGAVILNRVEHPSFPNTIYGVIYQPGAFSCLTDGQADQPVADSAHRAAREAMNGSDPCGGAIYYFNPATATNKWIWSRPLLTVIGKHRFCA